MEGPWLPSSFMDRARSSSFARLDCSPTMCTLPRETQRAGINVGVATGRSGPGNGHRKTEAEAERRVHRKVPFQFSSVDLKAVDHCGGCLSTAPGCSRTLAGPAAHLRSSQYTCRKVTEAARARWRDNRRHLVWRPPADTALPSSGSESWQRHAARDPDDGRPHQEPGPMV